MKHKKQKKESDIKIPHERKILSCLRDILDLSIYYFYSKFYISPIKVKESQPDKNCFTEIWKIELLNLRDLNCSVCLDQGKPCSHKQMSFVTLQMFMRKH